MPVLNYDWDEIEDNIVEEYDDGGVAVAEYTTEPSLYGNVISQNRGGVDRQMHFDALGSTLALTNDAQQVTDTRAYSAFGETTESTGTTSFPFQYVGQAEYSWDSLTGQYQVRRRLYQPIIARWSSVDPFEDVFVQVSEYLYVVNAPIMLADPSGLQADSGPEPTPERGVKVPDWPSCDTGCKETSRDEVFEGKVKSEHKISEKTIRCIYGFKVGAYLVYTRTDTISTKYHVGMMRRSVKCKKDCGSEIECRDKQSELFGPMRLEISKVVGREGRGIKREVKGKPPAGLPMCPEGLPPKSDR